MGASSGGTVRGTGLALPPAAPLDTKIFPLSEVKRGLRGVAYTVFEGVVPEPMEVETVNSNTLTLSSSSGSVSVSVVPAEGGILAFLNPKSPLAPSTTYTVTVNGVVDAGGVEMPNSTVQFTTTGKGVFLM